MSEAPKKLAFEPAASRCRKRARVEGRYVVLLYVTALAFGMAAIAIGVWASANAFDGKPTSVMEADAADDQAPPANAASSPENQPRDTVPSAIDQSATRNQHQDTTTDFVLRLVPTCVGFGTVLLLLRQAERHRRQGNEYHRVAMQLLLLEPFLEGLPVRQANVLRGAAAPLLFSRLLEDDDPLRASAWPSPEQLEALSDSL